MILLKENINNTYSLFFSGWFVLCVFLTSDLFCNEENDIKKYLALCGVLSALVMLVCFVKNTRQFIYHLFSIYTLRLLFTIGSFAALHGLFQLFYVLPSHHTYFRITGSFENPAGISAVLALLLPIGTEWLLKGRPLTKIFLMGMILMYWITIILSGARTAILASFLTTLFLLSSCTTMWIWLKKHKNIMFLFIIISLTIGILACHWKENSATGRLYIWRITCSLIAEHPLFGLGASGFKSHYMLTQADYFVHHPDSNYAYLADNISHPFNEFLLIFVNYGLVGFIVFAGLLIVIVFSAKQKKQWYTPIVLSVIVSFVILCMFSYPLEYAPVWIILIFVSSLPFLDRLPNRIGTIHRVIILILCAITFKTLYKNIIADMNWKRVSDKALAGQSEQMLPYFQQLYDNTNLRENPYFLYNYAAELNYSGHYRESVDMIRNCKKSLFDYDVAMLMSDNYIELHNTDSTIHYANLALKMIPSRFLPLQYMMDAYLENGDSTQAKETAKKILSNPIKVNSMTVKEIRDKARRIYYNIK